LPFVLVPERVHGNTLLETWVFNGAPFTREYQILETAEVCLP